MKSLTLVFFTLLVSVGATEARNTPCSGKKGGVARCLGEKFLCNDGSTSASKKTCRIADGGSDEDDTGSSRAGKSGKPR